MSHFFTVQIGLYFGAQWCQPCKWCVIIFLKDVFLNFFSSFILFDLFNLIRVVRQLY
jgi:hypothetical protein